jgi:xanthine dehydrogenase accessory factor
LIEYHGEIMKDIYEIIIERAENKQVSVLATIIVQTGSTPRGVGTAFVIMEDGSFKGTIGGGQLEARVLEEAEKVFKTRAPLRLSFVLKGTDVEKTEMLCGGDAEVFLEPISPDNQGHLDIYKRAKETIARGGTGMMVTAVDPGRWEGGHLPKIFFESEAGSIGSLTGQPEMEKRLAGEMGRILKKRQPEHVSFQDANGEGIEFLLEPVMSEPVLYVFGGGHVSLQIVPMAALVGFKVVVIDDRPEFVDPQKFPEAASVHEYPFEGVFDRLPVDQSSYIVIVTRGHLHDRTVLTQSLKSRARYIGMIGSRRKRAIVYKKLLEEGFTQADLDRVYSPIGIDIQAETPEEIAVSIVAELIKVRVEGFTEKGKGGNLDAQT